MDRQRSRQFGYNDFDMPKIDKKYIFAGAGALILIWLLLSSFYIVDAGERGVVQRFGKYVRTTTPGLQFKLPAGIESAQLVNIEQFNTEEFGFRSVEPGRRTTFSRGDFSHEALMLTGDLNAAVVNWIVQYRVNDPVRHLFNVRNPRQTIRDVTEAAMRTIVGDHSVDEVIGLAREEINRIVRDFVQGKLDEYGAGIEVVTINLQDVTPPEEVKPAFDDVNKAQQEKERIINEAERAYNEVIPLALGRAEQRIQEAEGYKINRINRAQGDADKFVSVWQEYNRARDVTRRRLYLETMQAIMPKIKEVYIVDENQEGLIPLLQLQNQSKGGGR